MKKRTKTKKLISVFLIMSMIAGYGIWDKMVHAYESSTSTTSRTYPNGYYDILINGPSGTERMNLFFTYSGNQMTQGDFNNAARTIGIKRGTSQNGSFVAEKSGVYNAKLVTSSAKTSKNSNGNYTRLKFNITFTQPAHQQYASTGGEKINLISTEGNTGVLNYSATTGAHSTSAKTVTVTCDITIYATGIVTYKSGSTYHRYWNSFAQCNLKRNNYTLSFNGNGGSVSQASRTVACGAQVGTLPTASRTGYSHRGWAWGAGDANPNAWNTSYICANTTFYALWSANQYTITYHGNGEDSGSMANTTATYDSNVTLRGNTFTKKGYTFLGWSTSANGSPSYTNGQTFQWKNTGNLDLYAVWKRTSFEVKLDGNGNGQTKTVEISVSNQHLPANDFKRSGYTFMGWSDHAESEKVLFKDQGNVGLDTDDTTLYAVWKKTDGSFLLYNLIHDDKMFLGDIYLEGGNGTGYDPQNTDSKFAKTDQDGQQGYFTRKEY